MARKKSAKSALAGSKTTPKRASAKPTTARASTKAPSRAASDTAASKQIDQRIRNLGGWRAATLTRMRDLILAADPGITEETKWRGTPVWSHDGIVCTGETYKDVVKLTFARGAALPDPAHLFNASLDGNTRRAIDIHEGAQVDARAFKTLIQAAVAENTRVASKRSRSKPSTPAQPKLLSGGNPQIAKADGDAPVQDYIAAIPGWKREVGRRLDALITRTLPGVKKAIRWNTPFYGIEGKGWIVAFHCFTNYMKVTFFNGASLQPLPPVGSKTVNTRYLHIHEDGQFDEGGFAAWLRQASRLQGWGNV